MVRTVPFRNTTAVGAGWLTAPPRVDDAGAKRLRTIVRTPDAGVKAPLDGADRACEAGH
jgi:hypothetical protein